MSLDKRGSVFAILMACALTGAIGLAADRASAAGASVAPEPAEPSVAAARTLVRRQVLHAVWGHGLGEAVIVPFVDATPDFSAHIRVSLHGAKRNAVYLIQRAPESGRDAATDHDGRCQRAFALPPWSASDAPAPSFVTFGTTDDPILLFTNGGGRGSVDFDFHTPASAGLTSGMSFDVVFRVLDDIENPSSLLLGECVTVKIP
jgi:hypothetical protein